MMETEKVNLTFCASTIHVIVLIAIDFNLRQ